MTKGKKFTKKNSVTYRLVYNEASRYDDEAPKHILVPITPGGSSKFLGLFGDAECSASAAKPERVFPSSGPRPDWDPDIVAGLDDDFDFENEENCLEEDFITKANAADGASVSSKCHKYDDDDVDSDDLGSDFSDDEDERKRFQTKSRKAKSTNYSMTSAITTCTEEVKAFNERFDKLMDLYDDDQIGALEFEEIEGHLSPECPRLQELVELASKEEPTLKLNDCNEEMKRRILEYVEEEKPEELVTIVTEKKAVEFDCESILSTYSNIYNHPTIIKIDHKGQRRKLTKSNLKKLDKEEEEECTIDRKSTTGASFTRPKDETTEERRERKKFVKEARRENRAIKKENKIAFKIEKRFQDQCSIQARNNAGIKML